jgi:hypothetical protein
MTVLQLDQPQALSTAGGSENAFDSVYLPDYWEIDFMKGGLLRGHIALLATQANAANLLPDVEHRYSPAFLRS